MRTTPRNPNPMEVLETAAKLMRLTGNQWSDWAYVTNNARARRNLHTYLQMGCPTIDCLGGFDTPTVTDGEKIARLILGDDYLSPRDVVKAYGLCYSGDQKTSLAVTVPDLETLLWLRAEGCILVATLTTEYNLLQLCEIDNPVFCRKGDSWFAKPRHTFSREDVVQSGQWLVFRKGAYPGSNNGLWEEQSNLLTEVEYVPNVAEVVYAVQTYYKARGIDLLKEVSVRTSSITAHDGRVFVGSIGADGPSVCDFWDDGHKENLGVSSALKLNLVSLNT